MNYLDVIILVPLVWGVYKGFSKGLVVEVAGLAALILGIWCALHFSGFSADMLVNKLNFEISSNYLPAVSFAVTFLFVAVVIILVSRVIDKFLSAIALGGVNKILGAIFGTIKVLLIVSILVYCLDGIDSRFNFIDEQKKESSIFYNLLVDMVNKWVPALDMDSIKSHVPENIEI